MSVNEQLPSADTTISPRASRPIISDLEALDTRLKRLSDNVFPLHPYLLTLPTNAPFRLGSRSTDNWAVGHDRPFNPEEQQLQYTTFLTHHDTDSLLVAVGDWADETGSMMIDQSTAPSTAETPKETVARKKISLKDYKTQKTSGTGTPSADLDQRHRDELSSANREEPKQASQTDVADKVDKNEPPSRCPSHSLPSPEKGPRKRPSTSEIERLSSQATGEPNMHSPKKPRLSPGGELGKDSIPSKSQSPRLPALLSPTLPPTKIPLSPTLPPTTRLPRLLSPTLPPDLEKELAKLEKRSPGHVSPRHDATATDSRRDDSIPPRTSSSNNSHSSSSAQNNRTTASSRGVTHQKQQLLVKLRYNKKNRKRVEALLKFSGKRKAHRSVSPPGQDRDHDDSSQVAKKNENAALNRAHATSDKLKPETKHGTNETHSQGDRRFKESKSSTEKPLTPASHPPSAAHDKVKSISLTPGKDSRNSTARRNELGDGGGKTPANAANKRHSVDPGTKDSPSQPDSRPRNNERRAWRDEFQKFSNTGRELKHAAERYKNGASIADEKLAVVTAIEAILCFILAFVADDQAKVLARQIGDSSTWISILAYWRVVRKNSASYPVLHSLCLLLGAVSYDAIHALDLDRLANSPLPGEHTPVPTPGSDGNAVPSDENRKSRKEFMELKSRLPECYKESQKLWLEGTRALSEDALSREFPDTWSQRSHNYAERGKIPLKAGDYAGDYFLPLGGSTPPVEVVRFGCSLLKEWCTQENVEWQRRLSL